MAITAVLSLLLSVSVSLFIPVRYMDSVTQGCGVGVRPDLSHLDFLVAVYLTSEIYFTTKTLFVH